MKRLSPQRKRRSEGPRRRTPTVPIAAAATRPGTGDVSLAEARPPGPELDQRPALAPRACGPDRAGAHYFLVTLDEPDLERWEPGFTRRKPKP